MKPSNIRVRYKGNTHVSYYISSADAQKCNGRQFEKKLIEVGRAYGKMAEDGNYQDVVVTRHMATCERKWHIQHMYVQLVDNPLEHSSGQGPKPFV